jgi:hypothetical protein
MPSFSKECVGGFVGFQGVAIDPNLQIFFHVSNFFADRAVFLRRATRSGVGARIPHDYSLAWIQIFRKRIGRENVEGGRATLSGHKS